MAKKFFQRDVCLLEAILRHSLLGRHAISPYCFYPLGVEGGFGLIWIFVLEADIPLLGQENTWMIHLQ
jgi:hypothetical protein